MALVVGPVFSCLSRGTFGTISSSKDLTPSSNLVLELFVVQLLGLQRNTCASSTVCAALPIGTLGIARKVSRPPPSFHHHHMNTYSDTSERLSITNRIAPLLLRLALGVTLLSAVADRFGIWGAPGAPSVAWGDWSHFVDYTAKVNSFAPSALAPVLAVIATFTEALLGVALILGIFPRPVAFASAALFALFAAAMTVSFGVKAPLNFSVFVDFAAAFLLAARPGRER
jgi:putative oxidoreductase